ncbi:TrkA family potassium uptake protein [Clostridium sp. UBA7503]|uniref:potassium channel family protein n=1 Tax=Clostridium sp. UBA7503 TaxID=1946377 RepID=UPI00321790A6
MKRKSSDYVIVAGCSKFGANIASMLSARGKSVIIIDINKNSFRKLSPDYSGYKIEGDATDIDVLIESGIEIAGTLVAATGDDNTNIMIAEIGSKIFGVDKVVSRLYDTEKEVVYDEFNVNIIRPTQLTIREFENINNNDMNKICITDFAKKKTKNIMEAL